MYVTYYEPHRDHKGVSVTHEIVSPKKSLNFPRQQLGSVLEGKPSFRDQPKTL